MSAEDYHKAASFENVRNDVLPAGRELSKGEIAALIEVCQGDRTAAGSRNAALIALMYVGGLRRSEIAGLDLEAYTPDTAQLVVRSKGNKERNVYLANGAVLAMADWLGMRGLDPGALFLPINKDGAIGSKRMTAQATYNILNKRAGQAGVRKFSPHDLRRTFVSDLLEAGANIAIVARMAGHANVQTTT
jgi:site-specific recombinase XerD